MNRIDNEIEKSKKEKSITPFIKYLIFSILEDSLVEVYGSNYSMKCLQSSIATRELLNDLGFHSKLDYGSCCFSIVRGQYPYNLTWGGFWDKDYHIWVITEYHELVDFTISQMHLHPKLDLQVKIEPILPLWYSPIDTMPSILKYLPQDFNIVVQEKLSGQDKVDLDSLLALAKKKLILARENNQYRMYEKFIIENPSVLEHLLKNGNVWMKGSVMMQQKQIPLPAWIQNKEKELLERL